MLQAALYITVFLAEVAIFAAVRSRALRQASLLIGSYLLYLTWEPWFAAILVTSTGMNYLLGRAIRREPRPSLLGCGIGLNLGVLVAFKYLPSVAVQLPFSSLQHFAHLALPLGISFWTFQAMSYLFDLYRGEELDPSLVEFALYMAFFPITISGPICRLPEMLPQFRSQKLVQWSDRQDGFARIATGVLMMQLARLLGRGILGGIGVAGGFDKMTQWNGPDVWCLAFGYGLQLFFDFAGYSHIAIGAAQALGLEIPTNFNRPFLSENPSVFWTRWHMSLSFWIRDYVFLPLAMFRRELWWRNAALVIAMVLFGLWHKATWLFLIWGCYHGLLLVLHKQVQQLKRAVDWNPHDRLWKISSWLTTAVFVSAGWIAFRATSLFQARQMLLALVTPQSYKMHYLSSGLYVLVTLSAASYGFVLLINDVLEKYASEGTSNDLGLSSRLLSAIAERRWYWIPPVYATALTLVSLVVQTQTANTAQLMYRSF